MCYSGNIFFCVKCHFIVVCAINEAIIFGVPDAASDKVHTRACMLESYREFDQTYKLRLAALRSTCNTPGR